MDIVPKWQAVISAKVAKQLSTYQRLTHLEIGGLGLERTGIAPNPSLPHTFYLTKIWPMSIGEGTTSSTYCEVSPEKSIALINRLAARGKAHLLKWWIHIHPIGSWSSTDISTMRQRVEEFIIGKDINWALSVVLTPGGFIARYDQAGKDEKDCWFIDLPITVAPKEEPVWVTHVNRLVKIGNSRKAPEASKAKWVPSKAITVTDPRNYRQGVIDFGDEIEYQSFYDSGCLTLLGDIIAQEATTGEEFFRCRIFGDTICEDSCSVCGFACSCYNISPSDIRKRKEELTYNGWEFGDE